MTKILYIAGYGRSGSTVLNIILGNHSSITSVGELSFLPEDWTNHHRVCSCGAPYHTCEFWKDLYLDQPPNPELLLPAADEVRKLVVRQLGATALFSAKFRENAARSLLLPKRRPGMRAPLWQQRKRAADGGAADR